MKRVKNAIRALAVVLIICMMMAVTVAAAETGSVWMNTETSTSETTALIVTDTTVTDGLIKLTYDSSKLTYKDVMVSSAYVAMHSVNAEEAGVVLISWVAPGAYESDGSAVVLIEVNFEGTAEDAIEVTGTAHDAEGNKITLGDVDTTALEEAIEDAGKVDEDKYTEESVAALEKALAAAEKVLSDGTATQEEVDAAAKALNDAIEALEEKPAAPTTEPTEKPTEAPEKVDTTELEEAIEKAQKVDEDLYTKASYGKMKEALTEARKVLRDKDATQEEVDAAADALNDAIAALKRSTGKNPGTGDDAMIGGAMLLAVVSLAGIGALVLLNKKNRRYAR